MVGEGGRREEIALSLGVVTMLAAAILMLLCMFPSHAQNAASNIQEVPRVVADSLARAGLSNISNMRQRGPNLTLNALTRTGALSKVVVNATSGAIIGFRIIDPYEINPDATRLK